MPDLRAFVLLPLALLAAACIPDPMDGKSTPPPPAPPSPPVAEPPTMPYDTPQPSTQPTQPSVAVGEPSPSAPSGKCDATKAYSLIGEMRGEALAARAAAVTGARTIRWVAPGAMVTMDYSADRLNVNLDTQGRVVGFKCG